MAAALPADQVELIAQVLEKLGKEPGGQAEIGALAAIVPTEPFLASVTELLRTWKGTSGVDGAGVALALRTAVVSTSNANDGSQVEVVWSGPEGEVDVRLTYAVLIEVIRAARRRLILVSFAAYHVPEVFDALRAASRSGVEVWVIVDGGTEALHAFAGVVGLAVFTWPPTLLVDCDPRHASLHAKAAIADDKLAFVTSANLTGHALDRNMELGLLVKGGHVPALLARHFAELVARGVLVKS